MDTHDRLALVTYHSTAQVVFGLRKMDKSGKDFANNKIADLQPLDSTNLWGGLEQGLDVLKDEARKNANSSLFLLT
ncbi:VWA domain-containing protein, partial [Salmonella sp. s51228]|uniref:VWA domain-containing protein n=1 Tax=Salmonella sp. s51228 TaxID=3159652 RepID=UPI00398136A3